MLMLMLMLTLTYLLKFDTVYTRCELLQNILLGPASCARSLLRHEDKGWLIVFLSDSP